MAIITQDPQTDINASRWAADDYRFGRWDLFTLGQKEGLETLSPNIALRYGAWKGSAPTPENPALSEEDWKSSPFYREGLKYFLDMTDSRAQIMAENFDEAKRSQQIRQMADMGFGGKAIELMGNLSMQAFEPINYIPFVNIGNLAFKGIESVAKVGAVKYGERYGIKALLAGIEHGAGMAGEAAAKLSPGMQGAVGNVAAISALSGANIAVTHAEHEDVNWLYTVGNIVVGGAIGYGLGRFLSPSRISEGMKKGLEDVSHDKPVNVEPVIGKEVKDAEQFRAAQAVKEPAVPHEQIIESLKAERVSIEAQEPFREYNITRAEGLQSIKENLPEIKAWHEFNSGEKISFPNKEINKVLNKDLAGEILTPKQTILINQLIEGKRIELQIGKAQPAEKAPAIVPEIKPAIKEKPPQTAEQATIDFFTKLAQESKSAKEFENNIHPAQKEQLEKSLGRKPDYEKFWNKAIKEKEIAKPPITQKSQPQALIPLAEKFPRITEINKQIAEHEMAMRNKQPILFDTKPEPLKEPEFNAKRPESKILEGVQDNADQIPILKEQIKQMESEGAKLRSEDTQAIEEAKAEQAKAEIYKSLYQKAKDCVLGSGE